MTEDWRSEFDKLPKITRDGIAKIAYKHNRKPGSIYKQVKEMIEIHPRVNNLKTNEEKYKLSLEIIDSKITQQATSTEAWREMVDFIAHEIVNEVGIITTVRDEYNPNRIYIYDKPKHCYVEDLPKRYSIISDKIYKKLNKYATEKTIREIINRISIITSDFECRRERDKHLIVLDNGLFNTNSFKLEPFCKNKLALNKLHIWYNQEKGYSKWYEYILDLFNGKKVYAETLQEFIGYIWIHGQPAKKLLFLDGDHDSGKSTFCSALIRIFGSMASVLNARDIGDRFRLSDLYTKRVNIGGDVDDHIDESQLPIIKRLTGGDSIKVERKYEHSFDMINDAKIIWNGNGAPRMPDKGIDDSAQMRRWLPLVFPNRYVRKPIYDNMTEEEKTQYKVGIPEDQFMEKLTSFEMKTQMLNWSFEGAKRLKRNDWVFSFEPDEDLVREWFNKRMVHTSIEDFMLDTMRYSPRDYLEKRFVYKQYCKWAEKQREPILDYNAFARKVAENRVFKVASSQPSIVVDGEKKQLEVWRGVAWQ